MLRDLILTQSVNRCCQSKQQKIKEYNSFCYEFLVKTYVLLNTFGVLSTISLN